MPFRSLRARLLLASSVLLVAVIGATLAWVGYQGSRLVTERLAADLARATALIRSSQAERYEGLRITAELLAAFPELNALAQTDGATIRDFLLDYQRRTQRADLLILLSPRGEVLARTDSVTPTPLPDVTARWIEPTLAGRPPAGLLEAGDSTYMGTAAAAEAAGTVFAFLVVGSRIDGALAARLRDLTGEETLILGRRSVLGSTLGPDTLPWTRIADWISAGPARRRDTTAHEVQVGGERYVAREADTGTAEGALFVSLQSRDRAMAPYRRIQAGLLLVGLLGAVVGIAASAVVARRIARPVAALAAGTREVAAGHFDASIPEPEIEELGALARSFNEMTRGLRERADMQKFVSQSTVQMIRAAGPASPAASARRSLTILFSDIRGFTALAETRPPEDVVRVLNACLGLQAERVQAFGGDIDKFIGDAVVALFDGPDMALRAIRCAVEIQRAMDRLPLDAAVSIGIGIATGEVVLGSIGGGDRFDYTAVGLHVNLAARLSSMAGAREILLAESTWRPVRDFVAAERLDDLAVKGFSGSVAVYRMVVPGE